MMDSNDNDDYSFQESSANTGNESKGAIPKVVVLKYQNQFNNNNNVADQENLMPQINGAAIDHSPQSRCNGEQVVNGCDTETVLATPESAADKVYHNGKSCEALVSESYSHQDLPAKTTDSEDGDLDGEYSDNNSLGNLSYISENGLIEEIILLPNNIYSDDENGSASDDCVYAYRGDNNAHPILDYREPPADDETDFLEMDFDPEPSSEIENLLEHQEIDVNSFPSVRNVERLSLQENENNPLNSLPYIKECPVKQPEKQPIETNNSTLLSSEKQQSEIKNTGAIPKKSSTLQSCLDNRDFAQPGPSRTKGNSKNLKLDLKLCTENSHEANYRHNYPHYRHQELLEDDEDSSCLDCTEHDFLMQTKQDLSVQKVCRSCHKRNMSSGGQPVITDYFNDVGQSLNSSNSETDLMSMRAEQIVLQALNKINELKATPPSLGISRSMDDFCMDTSSDRKEQEVPINYTQDICSENTVTIYTLNCGELTIIEALTRIGVAPNLDILHQYFTEQYEIDTSKMNIPQYLLHMSKRDCNFRKLIEAIKSCCDDPLDVQYYPLDPFTDTPEVVQVNSYEIAKRWNANTNLRQIINFKHKHFHTLNVLGKIVNILRQPSRGRHTNQTINIPQYYKSGSITITRIT